MSPWEKYQGQGGPWERYAGTEPVAPPVEQPPVDFSLLRMFGNIPTSAGRAASDMIQPILNPVDTLSALGNIIAGAAQKLWPGEQSKEAYADAVGQYFKDRYGSIDNIKRTAMEDPVGTLMDLSGAVGGVGGATRALTKTGSLPNMVGRVLTTTGSAIDPLNLAISPAKSAVSKLIPQALPKSLYQGSAKFPPVSVPIDVRDAITETALANKIMPTQHGIDKITDILQGLDTKIDDLVNSATAAGKTIPRQTIYTEIWPLLAKLKQGANAPAEVDRFTKIVFDLEKELATGPAHWTPKRLQDFKTQTYQSINWRGKPGVKQETLKALARGARKGMEGVTPEIADVNKVYGPLAELRDRLPQVVNRIENLNPLPLSTGLWTSGGGALAGSAGAAIGGIASLLNDPKIAARLALYLRNLKDKGLFGNFVDNAGFGAPVRQGLFQSGRLEEFGE